MGTGELLAFDDELLQLALAQPEIIQGTDAGESIFQSGPSPGTETVTGADTAVIALASAETCACTDSNGSVNNAFRVSDFDSSHSIVTSTAVDTDRAQFIDGKGSSFSDSDSATGTDRQTRLGVSASDAGAFD